jgi:hypothetical protein
MSKIYTKSAVWNGKNFGHFGIHPQTCCLYGDEPEDIENVEFTISDDQSLPISNDNSMNVDYWGWIDTGDDNFSSMIYPKYFLLDMCFPYGIKKTELAGQGKAYRLTMITKK